MAYVYIRPYFTETLDDGRKRRVYDECYTTGFYDPSGEWHADNDYATREEAAKRVAWLNGSRAEEAANV